MTLTVVWRLHSSSTRSPLRRAYSSRTTAAKKYRLSRTRADEGDGGGGVAVVQASRSEELSRPRR